MKCTIATCIVTMLAGVAVAQPIPDRLGLRYDYTISHGFASNGITFWTVEPPGVPYSALSGIDGNLMVGHWSEYYLGPTHGFIYDGTNYTTIDYPGAQFTNALDVSGNIVAGAYLINGYPDVAHGFTYDGVNWATFDVPGSDNTIPQSIDGNTIVGWYHRVGDPPGRTHGFTYDFVASTYTTLDYPGAANTEAYGIGNGLILGGRYGDDWQSSGIHGFVYDGMNWTTFDVPGMSYSFPSATNGTSFVGRFTPGPVLAAGYHGFVHFDGTYWATIDVPGAESTQVLDFDGGIYVGQSNLIPEPGTLALLIVACPLAISWRRRKGTPRDFRL